jgi:uncharacterized protein HemX
MKLAIQLIAVALGLALGSAAYAQTRHDEKAHGSGKPAAVANEGTGANAAPGRHDERPHGKAKKVKKAEKKPADADKK